MATLSDRDARKADTSLNLAQSIKSYSVGSSQIGEEDSCQVGSVLVEAMVLGCHFHGSAQAGWAEPVLR